MDLSRLVGSIITVTSELLEYENDLLAFRVQLDTESSVVASGLHTRKIDSGGHDE